MNIVLCTLCLNEIEWLPKLYAQHKDWLGLVKWVFVEAADKIFAGTNPTMINFDGLSVDGTTEFLDNLTKQDNRVVHIKHGITSSTDPAQGKCAARQLYLDIAEKTKPDLLIVLDADEFYTHSSQRIIPELADSIKEFTGCVLKHREIWRPSSIVDQPLFQYEVIGGFWDIPYCRIWRWMPRLTYSSNHNTPQQGSYLLDRKLFRGDVQQGLPQFIHTGFASNGANRKAKNNYYKARGEGTTDHRSWYVESRAAFETWQPGDELPHRAKVIEYDGPIPEAFQ